MLPATRRWFSRSSFHAKRIQDRRSYEGLNYTSLISPSEYKKFALICFLILTGSLLIDREGAPSPHLMYSSSEESLVSQRDAANREFIASITDGKEADSQLVPVGRLPVERAGEIIIADEEEVKKQEMRKFMEVYRTNCMDIGCRYLKYV